MASAVCVPTEFVGAVTHVGRELTVSLSDGRGTYQGARIQQSSGHHPHHFRRYRLFQAKVRLESRQAQES
ncbi:hypothetical protein PR003_g29492 [Phytophthora rubi]|uniref:Uncharacterized protein n=1 Tax=Phytophthora rubi TaxID=129364 RepID=A0A6A4BR65_9STRA|nr:hypothetical protein PR002_g22131 [Phytophthora rubi]KAE9274856.1 hypothetical protein PR003_g29492 [Phytophthora rubi]